MVETTAVGLKWDTTEQTHKAFYISFYHPARPVHFVTLGEEEKEEKNYDSRSLSCCSCEVTAGSRCVGLVLAVKNTSTLSELTGQNTSECSISTVYHTIFVIN